MPIFQSFNKRNKSWVKYELNDGNFRPIDVKQREPRKPFKGIKKK